VGLLRVNRTLHLLLISALAGMVLVVLPGTEARADPTVAEIEAQIASVWATAEPLIEQYNGIHEQYNKNKAQQQALATKIEPLQRQVELGQLRVGAIAAGVYEGGEANTFNALVTSGSPGFLADQLSFIDQMARTQARQLSGVSTLKQQYDAQKAPLDKLVSDLAAQDADLAAKKKLIDAQIAQLQALRNKAYGSSGTTGSYRPWPCPSTYLPTNGYKAAKFACSQAGKPYVWDAAGPSSYDCSGLTLAAWQSVGVSLPHNAASQRASMPAVTRANLALGDLVFYYSDVRHVGIYVGDGKVMHAPQPGDHVRMADMDGVGPIKSFGRPS
jgi:peptidoglycan DL-endopeptidase CwlO